MKCIYNYRLDLDTETSSSFYDESDTSSIPHTPSSLPDSAPSHPRTLTEALAHTTTKASTQRTFSDTGVGGSSSAEGDDGTLKAQNNYRLSAPDPSWYSGGRSLSPASPRVSPAPKGIKSWKCARSAYLGDIWITRKDTAKFKFCNYASKVVVNATDCTCPEGWT